MAFCVAKQRQKIQFCSYHWLASLRRGRAKLRFFPNWRRNYILCANLFRGAMTRPAASRRKRRPASQKILPIILISRAPLKISSKGKGKIFCSAPRSRAGGGIRSDGSTFPP